MDGPAVGKRHHLRQLAARRQVTGDVSVVCCDSFQMFGYGNMRIEDEYGLLEFTTECTNGSRLICIPRHQRKTVYICPHRIYKSRDSKIHI